MGISRGANRARTSDDRHAKGRGVENDDLLASVERVEEAVQEGKRKRKRKKRRTGR